MPAQALILGRVSRNLPQADVDGGHDGEPIRIGRYDEQYNLTPVRKTHILADEGSYFITTNNQTAITGPAGTAFAATAAALAVINTDSPGNPAAKRIYLDYAAFLSGGTAFSNATSNTGMFWALTIDSGNRYTSGGTSLTPNIVSPNMDGSPRASVANVYFGALVTSAATSAARTLVGQRLFREPVSATALSLINMDDWHFNFGGVETAGINAVGSSGVVQANLVHKAFSCPPVVIGPNQSALLHVWLVVNSAPVGGTLFPEVGWWER